MTDQDPLDNTLTGRDQMSRLWAGWRIPYILAGDDERAAGHQDGMTLFEGIGKSDLDDSVTYIVWRGERCYALLNAYPYSSGHLLVVPNEPAVHLEDLEQKPLLSFGKSFRWESLR